MEKAASSAPLVSLVIISLYCVLALVSLKPLCYVGIASLSFSTYHNRLYITDYSR